MNTKKYIAWMAATAFAAILVGVAPVLAQTEIDGATEAGITAGFHGGNGPAISPRIVGTVSAVNGATLIVNSVMGKMHRGIYPASTTTVYTVDASSARIFKNAATSSVSAIAVGDTIMVEGTISGTNVTANIIRGGIMEKGRGMLHRHR